MANVFLGFTKPNVVLMTIGVFLLLKYLASLPLPAPETAGRAVVNGLSRYSLGIYLLHPLLLEHLRCGSAGLWLSGERLPPLLGVPLMAAALVLAGVAVSAVIRRVPGLGWLIP
jgi:surface polysaccharide O-acyltransferase-like enzyme